MTHRAHLPHVSRSSAPGHRRVRSRLVGRRQRALPAPLVRIVSGPVPSTTTTGRATSFRALTKDPRHTLSDQRNMVTSSPTTTFSDQVAVHTESVAALRTAPGSMFAAVLGQSGGARGLLLGRLGSRWPTRIPQTFPDGVARVGGTLLRAVNEAHRRYGRDSRAAPSEHDTTTARTQKSAEGMLSAAPARRR